MSARFDNLTIENHSLGVVGRKVKLAAVTLCCAFALLASNQALAQFDQFNAVVGGVKIDANGVLAGERAELSRDLRSKLDAGLSAADRDIHNSASLRMISLKGLHEAIREAKKSGQPLPAEVQFMAGLQRIEYVVLDPDKQDIILAGPGEGWRVDRHGNVVGDRSGMPVIHLQDFLVAMRSVENARKDYGISVSIDPTEEGIRSLQQLYNQIKRFEPAMAKTVEQTLGPQVIKLTGVPANSRFSQILVAADYKMKRLSMGLDPAPISKMPSMLDMARHRDAGLKKMAPRFWMECNYEPVAVSDDETVWQLRGTGVKTLTEEQYFSRDGKRAAKGKTNRLAQKWADEMTERFDELSKAEPVFRELRNMMDLSVVAAIIARGRFLEKTKLQIPLIVGPGELSTPEWNVPKTVPTQCSFAKLSRSWIVTASGGVQVDSWGVASNIQRGAVIGKVGQTAVHRTANRWWWNGSN